MGAGYQCVKFTAIDDHLENQLHPGQLPLNGIQSIIKTFLGNFTVLTYIVSSFNHISSQVLRHRNKSVRQGRNPNDASFIASAWPRLHTTKSGRVEEVY